MTTSHQILASEARVRTSVPSRYLGQLCMHFQHALPVIFDENRGRIEFSTGICELDASASPEILVLRVTTEAEPVLAALEDVVARHLLRFAFREKPEITWKREI